MYVLGCGLYFMAVTQPHLGLGEALVILMGEKLGFIWLADGPERIGLHLHCVIQLFCDALV